MQSDRGRLTIFRNGTEKSSVFGDSQRLALIVLQVTEPREQLPPPMDLQLPFLCVCLQLKPLQACQEGRTHFSSIMGPVVNGLRAEPRGESIATGMPSCPFFPVISFTSYQSWLPCIAHGEEVKDLMSSDLSLCSTQLKHSSDLELWTLKR